MAKFIVEVEGELDDLQVIKDRCVAAVEEVPEEYAANLDGDVFVTSQWED